MKTLIRYTGVVVVASVLVGVLAFLYLKTEALDPTHRNAVNGVLRDLKQVDAEWNVELLRSKSWLTKNYDAVTQPQRVTLQLERAISEQSTVAMNSSLSDAQAQLKKALDTKIDLVDQFKAQNAITRNSLRFIPSATAELKARAKEAGDGNPAKRAQMSALSEAAEQVLIDTLKLDSSSDSGAIPAIRHQLGALVGQRDQYPPAVLEAFNVYSNHLITILAQKEREEDLLEQLGKLPVVQRIDTLATTFDSVFEKADEQRETYRIAMFSYSGFLMLLLAFLAFRRRPA
jgi:two-component system, NtrC family, sensor kinase